METIIFRFDVKVQGCIFEFLEKKGGHDAYYKVVQWFKVLFLMGIRDPFPDLKATRPPEIRAEDSHELSDNIADGRNQQVRPGLSSEHVFPFLTNTHPKMWAMFTTLVTFDWIWLVYRVPDNGIV